VGKLSVLTIFILMLGLVSSACSGSKSDPKNPNASITPSQAVPAATNPGSTLPRLKILVGMDASYPPFEEVDLENKIMVGFDVDLLQAIAARENIAVELNNVSYNTVISGVAQCQFDAGISAISITEDLKPQMNFSNPYYSLGQVLVVKTGNVAITGLDQLSGMTVGAQKNTSSEKEVAKIQGARLKDYPNFELAFEDLITGMIDAVVADYPVALSFVDIKANKLKIVGNPFSVENYGIAVCSKNTELLNRINDGLASIKADGTIDRLAAKWITSPNK
jgi:polar amino acid transport system substrate-binding protein